MYIANYATGLLQPKDEAAPASANDSIIPSIQDHMPKPIAAKDARNKTVSKEIRAIEGILKESLNFKNDGIEGV